MAEDPGRRAAMVLAVAAVLVLAGCVSAPTAGPAGGGALDPDRELGVVDGVAAGDPIDVEAGDGFNETERRLLVARTMARVEVIRERRFTHRVPIEVIDREAFGEERLGRERWRGADAEWGNAVWRSLFLVEAGTDVQDVLDELYVGSVLGYYDPAEERIVLVADDAGAGDPDGDDVRIDRATLAHELVHALQHQRVGLSVNRTHLDGQLAGQAVVEGDARYVEGEIEARCADGRWRCLERPTRSAGGGGGGPGPDNLGVFVLLYHPYSDGPAFVADRLERGGWDAVDRAHETKPTSTTVIIHPERYDRFEPATPRVPDRSSGPWRRYEDLERRDEPGVTVGEAGLYAMFWANGVIDREHLFEDADPRSPYNYSHPITDGWAGDRLVPYHDGEGGAGFVHATTWRSEADAAAFAEAYGELLDGRGTERVDARTALVPEDRAFTGAYRIHRTGRTVTVVHAPTVEELTAVHGDVGGSDAPATASPSRASAVAAGSGTGTETGNGSGSGTGSGLKADVEIKGWVDVEADVVADERTDAAVGA